jgi:hypothetical protein
MVENGCQENSFVLDTDAIFRKGKKVQLALCLTN